MSTESKAENHNLPFALFYTAFGLQLAAIVGIFALVTPKVFQAEIANPWSIVGWIVLLGLPLSLFEYLYHRYLLHSAVLPFISSMHRAHSTHHGLTYVKAPVTPNEPAKLVPVRNKYPIVEPHQEESMMFPVWSLPIFEAVFILLLGLPLKMLFPGQPVMLSLILSVALYLMAYEVWHAILHLPFEKFWKPFIESKLVGKMGKRMYSFHLMHHWRPTSNLAIVGFWGLAVWDYVFRTHRRPERIPLEGAEVNYHDAELKKPLWPIALFDGWQSRMYKGSRAIERSLARIFLKKQEAKQPVPSVKNTVMIGYANGDVHLMPVMKGQEATKVANEEAKAIGTETESGFRTFVASAWVRNETKTAGFMYAAAWNENEVETLFDNEDRYESSPKLYQVLSSDDDLRWSARELIEFCRKSVSTGNTLQHDQASL